MDKVLRRRLTLSLPLKFSALSSVRGGVKGRWKEKSDAKVKKNRRKGDLWLKLNRSLNIGWKIFKCRYTPLSSTPKWLWQPSTS
jgi:hypothetical protein